MPNDKQIIDRIAQLKGAAESASKELARHEAEASVAEKKVSEIETQLTDAGFDVSQDLTAQLAAASAEMEAELSAIGTELEALR